MTNFGKLPDKLPAMITIGKRSKSIYSYCPYCDKKIKGNVNNHIRQIHIRMDAWDDK